jgi:hypothetical protein
MAASLPRIVLIAFLIIVAAMPWRRLHPNQVFMLEMLQRLSDDDTVVSHREFKHHRLIDVDAEECSVPEIKN